MKRQNQKSLAIVIPTYNESQNIEKLIGSLLEMTKPQDRIVVVDDNSPDKTAQIVQRISKKQKRVALIVRKNMRGRGSAVLEGFRFAKKFNPGYFVEMDADFSHKPQDIKLLAAKADGAQVVIGSRYLKGSQIINWSIKRRIFSRLANAFAKALLSIPISDYTNGFRLYDKKSARLLLAHEFKTQGYITLSESAYILYKNGIKFAQIPIVFVNRTRGGSNLSAKEIKNALFGILKIRFLK